MNDTTGTVQRIEQQLKNNPVLLYMKGSPQFPQCGFSAQVVGILGVLQAHYAYIDVLKDPAIRAELPVYAQWPTFPQLYIQGTLIGGCDIVCELHAAGDLRIQLMAVNALKEQVLYAVARE